MRWVLHVDMNSYFASVEQQCNPLLRGRAVGVGGKPGTRSVIAAASREAKARGVKTGMSASEAVQRCPELQIVEPDYPKYRAYSERLFGLLDTLSPYVEIFSIDEAFVELDRRLTPADITSLVRTLKARLRHALGPVLTASVGIAHNKRLAKLASESMKPDGIVALLDDHEHELVQTFKTLGIRARTRGAHYVATDIEELAGIGPRLGRRLRGGGVHTLQDLAECTLDELRTLVFPYERELWLVGQGIDPSPVVPHWAARAEQSIGHQYTLPADTPVRALEPTLMWLAERVASRMRRRGFVAQRLTLYFRRTGAPSWQASQRTTQRLESDRDVFTAAMQLVRDAVRDDLDALTTETRVRMPALTVSELTPRASTPQSLFGPERSTLLTRAVDRIRERFGSRAVTSGLTRAIRHHVVPDGRQRRFSPEPPNPAPFPMT